MFTITTEYNGLLINIWPCVSDEDIFDKVVSVSTAPKPFSAYEFIIELPSVPIFWESEGLSFIVDGERHEYFFDALQNALSLSMGGDA